MRLPAGVITGDANGNITGKDGTSGIAGTSLRGLRFPFTSVVIRETAIRGKWKSNRRYDVNNIVTSRAPRRSGSIFKALESGR